MTIRTCQNGDTAWRDTVTFGMLVGAVTLLQRLGACSGCEESSQAVRQCGPSARLIYATRAQRVIKDPLKKDLDDTD